MQHFILALTLLLTTTIFAQTQQENPLVNGQTLKVSVINALSDNGTVAFALYNQETFMKTPLFSKSAPVEQGVSSVIFESVPEGAYAIICFHDENGNGKMDFQENGMPKESFGTSNNALNFGPPQFENSKFEVKNEDLTLEIKF